MSTEDRSMSSFDFDVCVIGHITKDIINVGGTKKTTVGGTAYYTSIGLKKFGLRVGVVTRVAEADEALLLQHLKGENIAVFAQQSETTSAFENAYSSADLDKRCQRIRSIGTPFLPEDVGTISAGCFHVGPLTSRDISVNFLEQLANKPGILSLDVQGMLRPARMGKVSEEDWPHKEEGLSYVDILKADEKEALVLSGKTVADRAAAVLASFGPKEIIITMGGRGSLIYAEQTMHRVPRFVARKRGDPTGCGDTYMAGYLSQRLKGVAPDQAGRFAAATATLKIEGSGPFLGSEADVNALLSGR